MIDWTDPTQEELDALALVHRQLKFHTKATRAQYHRRYNLNDLHVAEIVLYATDSLWYVQLQRWATMGPGGYTVPPSFCEGARWLLESVKNGFTIPAGKEDRAFFIADFILMLRQLRDQGRCILSQTFEVIADLVLGISWEKRFKALVAAAS